MRICTRIVFKCSVIVLNQYSKLSQNVLKLIAILRIKDLCKNLLKPLCVNAKLTKIFQLGKCFG